MRVGRDLFRQVYGVFRYHILREYVSSLVSPDPGVDSKDVICLALFIPTTVASRGAALAHMAVQDYRIELSSAIDETCMMAESR